MGLATHPEVAPLWSENGLLPAEFGSEPKILHGKGSLIKIHLVQRLVTYLGLASPAEAAMTAAAAVAEYATANQKAAAMQLLQLTANASTANSGDAPKRSLSLTFEELDIIKQHREAKKRKEKE